VSTVRKWLETSEAQDLLARVARLIWREVRVRRLSLSFITHDFWADAVTEDLINDIQSELCLFILEGRSRIQEVLTSGAANTASYLKAAFINHWIGMTRGPDKDRRRHLHKRLGDVLRASEGFHTSAKGARGMTFSLALESLPIPPLSSEDMAEIPFPYASVAKLEYDQINKKAVLFELSRHFWNHVSAMWEDKPVQVDVADLVDWISLHVSMRSFKKEESLPHGQDKPANPIEQVQDDRPRPDQEYFDPELVKSWAQKLANRLNEKEKAVLYLRVEEELTFEATAKKMGLRGPSGSQYHQEKAEEKLRSFLRDLPWVSSDDLNDKACSLFHETLFSVLKKSVPKP